MGIRQRLLRAILNRGSMLWAVLNKRPGFHCYWEVLETTLVTMDTIRLRELAGACEAIAFAARCEVNGREPKPKPKPLQTQTHTSTTTSLSQVGVDEAVIAKH